MILTTRKERVGLLKSGYTGEEIEELYDILNGFEIVGVNWDEAAAKCTRRNATISSFVNLPDFVHVLAAPSQGASA